MENKGLVSYKEAFRRNVRAWKILWNLCPNVFITSLLTFSLKSLSPYVTVWLSAQLINELAGNRDSAQLIRWIVLQLAAGGILALLNGILSRWHNYENESCQRIYDRVYIEKMLSLDYADLDRQYVFDLYSQIKQTEQWHGWGIYNSLRIFQEMISAIALIGGGLGLSISLFVHKVPDNHILSYLNHPVFAIAILALMLLIALISPLCMNRGSSYWNQYDSNARLGNRRFSFYGFMCKDRKRAGDIRMYCQQEEVCSVYLGDGSSFGLTSDLARFARGPMGLWFALAKAISVILTGIIYLFVCLKAWGKAFGIGAVMQYVGSITNIFMGISVLIEGMGTMRANGEFLKNSYDFLDIPNNMYQGSLTTEKRVDRQYEVEFKDVSFQYPGSEQWALRHVSMKFNVGTKLAVVGINGSGKTTFIKLLCRLYDPTEGQILLNGIDIRKYKYDDYIHIFSVVFQDFSLMALTLGENVAGGIEYDEDAVKECLHNAAFDETLTAMEKGLNTYLYKDLSKEGVEVSGGEAQKIAIARALYRDAPFIVLDEPTAALDPMAEAEIYSRFNDIVSDRTAIYISHRLSSCKFCDEILVFHDGIIVQQGSHIKLVSDELGKYYELWNAQAQYYVEKC